jgi:hypothetical protein
MAAMFAIGEHPRTEAAEIAEIAEIACPERVVGNA